MNSFRKSNTLNHTPAIDNDELINPLLCIGPAALDTLPRNNATGICVHFPYSHAAMEATITSVTTEARTASIAHPGP
jgi:hypothetical protein